MTYNDDRDAHSPDNEEENDDVLDISLDDLEDDAAGQVPAAAPLPPAGAPSSFDVLVIEDSDLDEEPDSAKPPPGDFPPTTAPASHYPSAATDVPMPGKGKQGMLSGGLIGSLLVQMVLAGALGGLVAWMINEPIFLQTDRQHHLTPGEVFLQSMLFFAVIGGILGLALAAVEGISAMNVRKAVLNGLMGLLIGGVGGVAAGFLGQAAYGLLGGTGDSMSISQIMARTVGWSIAGLFIGLAQGAWSMAPKKMINGLCGGAMGGFVGGLLFDPIGVIMSLTAYPGLLSRLVAIVVMGAACGAAIGLIEELRKEAWLRIVGGPLTGKQFILYRQQTVIGSDPGCDIALFKDPAIAPRHCIIEMSGAQCTLQDLDTPNGVVVNGDPVRRHTLRSGDIIQLGQTALEYNDRVLQQSQA